MARRSFRGGVHPEEHKELSRDVPFEEYLPRGEMVYPLGQHIGKPASPVVSKGDRVLAGQLIAEASAFVSANNQRMFRNRESSGTAHDHWRHEN